jgi:hypothetical protein
MQRIAGANLPAKPPQTCERPVYDRAVKLAAALVSLALAAAGCARDDGPAAAPAACLGQPAAFVEALSAAPAAVRVDGVPISDCLGKDASQGDVQVVGSVLVAAAERLGEERRALPLGYLVGALRRGSQRTQGIHAELVRRVEQEAAPLAGSRAFERGLRAGRNSG